MKRSAVLYHLVLAWLCVVGIAALAQQPSETPPHAILLNDHALAPVRPLAAAVGAMLDLDASTGMVTLTRENVMLTITPYDLQIDTGGQQTLLPVPPLLRAGQLFVPVRAVAETFGATAALRGGTAQDSAKHVAVTYQDATSIFRAVEGGRVLTADLTGDAQVETAFAVANVPGIDAYNSPYVSDIVPLEVWVVQNSRTLWRRPLATGVSVSRFEAPDLSGDRTPELLLYYFTRHNYMGPYPGSVYTVNAFRWDGGTFGRILTLDYSRDRGRLYTEAATLGKAAAFILTDTNWKRNQDTSHYSAELYAWNGRRFTLAERRVTSRAILSETAARRLLGLIE